MIRVQVTVTIRRQFDVDNLDQIPDEVRASGFEDADYDIDDVEELDGN